MTTRSLKEKENVVTACVNLDDESKDNLDQSTTGKVRVIRPRTRDGCIHVSMHLCIYVLAWKLSPVVFRSVS